MAQSRVLLPTVETVVWPAPLLGTSATSLAMDAEISPGTAKKLRSLLLDWYDASARVLPWRVSPDDQAKGLKPDPYRVWLSEIMLQQTTVATVTPRYNSFFKVAPTVEALAALPQQDVMALWAGLGYYARARNLHACAKEVVALGGFPAAWESLRKLPGIGDYTAAAIASIAFNLPHTPVDGNVERVLSRLLRLDEPLPKAKPTFQRIAKAFDDPTRPGDFAQALMDLGAMVCTPKRPACGLCPWFGLCASANATDVEAFPKRAPKKPKPRRVGAVLVLTDHHHVLLEQRPGSGLLGGMLGLPGGHWTDVAGSVLEPVPVPAHMRTLAAADPVHAGVVTHIFTHFRLELSVWHAPLRAATKPWSTPYQLTAKTELSRAAIPTVMKKALSLALGESVKAAQKS